ncbi:MAG: CheR family methyltransferase [Fibrobacterota bacterium]
MNISDDDFSTLQKILYDESGIFLPETKDYLLRTRLTGVMHREGIGSLEEIIRRIRTEQALRHIFVDAMTTNETSFFRERPVFKALAGTLLPELLAHRNGQIRIWSAAASTGQEAYSLLMAVEEEGDITDSARLELVGTDISRRAVEKAVEGIYSSFELGRGLTRIEQDRYFTKIRPTMFQIRRDLRRRVSFRRTNLLRPAQVYGPFDLVLCRNVAIYFNDEDKRRLFSAVAQRMHPGAILVIGSTEQIPYMADIFTKVNHAGITVYRKKLR